LNNDFPLVPLREILSPVSRPEEIEPQKTYSILGAHWYAKGLYTKDIKEGAQIRASKVYRVEEGDFVYNRLFAWKGAFAIANAENHGCYVSSEFPCFTINQDRAHGQYLWRYFSRTSAWDEALGLSSGGTPTSRNRLKVDKLLAMKIPLPPLPKQRRIVARIEELATRIEDARGLRRQAVEEGGFLRLSALASVMESNDASWQQQTVADVIITMDAGWSPGCDDHPATNGEWGVLKTTAVQWSNFNPAQNKALPKTLTPRPHLGVVAGDVLVTRAGPRKRVGVVAAVRHRRPELMISDKLIRLRPDQSKINPYFLELSLASPFSQEHLVRRKTGLADAQVNISQSILRSTPVAYPSLVEQQRIVTYLNDLQEKVDSLKQLQSETAAELDALLPSVLDRAFKGGL
jgi:type I restriction enzyme, S subunit